jgi:two-component SAPR family response regulator
MKVYILDNVNPESTKLLTWLKQLEMVSNVCVQDSAELVFDCLKKKLINTVFIRILDNHLGLDIVEKINTINPFIKIIMYSEDKDDARYAKTAGADEFLLAPLEKILFDAVMKRIMSKNKILF